MVAIVLFMFERCAPITIAQHPHPTPHPAPVPQQTNTLTLQEVGIPKGHIPPPGSCRIWYPGQPAGKQPPPFRCGTEKIPMGTFLVQRLDNKTIRIDEYDAVRPNFILRTGNFVVE